MFYQHSASSSRSTSSGVESRNSRWRQQEAERLERVADLWDQVRTELQQERHQQLQKKVVLQRQLLRAQDYLAVCHRQKQQERLLQRRTEAKHRRRTTEAALVDVCKQSLDSDRERAIAERQVREIRVVAPRQADHAGEGDSASVVPRRRHGAWQRPGYQHKQLLSLTSTKEPGNDQRQDRPAGADNGAPEGTESSAKETLSWQRSNERQRPGQQMDSTQTPRLSQQASNKLNSFKGHIGAGELWDVLREESKTKLVQSDQRFPQELKAAFGAFVRERLTKHCPPVQRSFCASEDVPDIDQLLDQSHLQHTKMLRHKAELMYRASLNNRDRTTILMYNNPLPDVADSSQQDSISRYIPSWEEADQEKPAAEYMKWLTSSGDKANSRGEDQRNTRHSAHSCQLSESAQELQNIWLSIAQQRHKHSKTLRYHFLTDKGAESDGTFSKKFQEEQSTTSLHQIRPDFKSHSALELSHDEPEVSATSVQERGHSADIETLQKFRSDWQPLSMTALREYKKQMETGGSGSFGQGRSKMWPVVSFT
ncbi:uncharacterized protein LOC112571853 isoform X1 [Pomacea canaliculata]|nr:uncharacterized protein LOC112571853 isoform X1 [Pomacea canaliculata]XP_025106978.1 uncharacterized protein LOC112571853 isoform X1 [Pomacea canaliculata]